MISAWDGRIRADVVRADREEEFLALESRLLAAVDAWAVDHAVDRVWDHLMSHRPLGRPLGLHHGLILDVPHDEPLPFAVIARQGRAIGFRADLGARDRPDPNGAEDDEPDGEPPGGAGHPDEDEVWQQLGRFPCPSGRLVIGDPSHLRDYTDEPLTPPVSAFGIWAELALPGPASIAVSLRTSTRRGHVTAVSLGVSGSM